VKNPGMGIYISGRGEAYFKEDGIEYLTANRDHRYYWSDVQDNNVFPNAVGVSMFNGSQDQLFVGRTTLNGQVRVGFVHPEYGLYYRADGKQFVSSNYQVLRCDPEPAYACSK
jgi:Protein of unknown function (DUF3421)